MIKMLINEEEVVSNKEFTIKEEMLSTSSTILNNCYPKSWEDTKDYVNNFYYPLDYSKFKLEEGDFLHGNTQFAELNASGINPSFETNVEKEFKSIEIDGKSYQATSTDPVSPSPDNPSEVECIKGINLLKGLSTPTTDTDYWYSVSTPYFTPLEDGWGKFEYDNTSGTSTSYINAKVKLSAVELKENTSYTLITEIRNSNISENAGAFLQMTTANATIAFQKAVSIGYSNINAGGVYKSVIKTKESFTNVSTAIDTYLRLAAGTKGTVEARISLIEGDVSISDYVPYGCIQIKNVGKNLQNTNLRNGIYNANTGEFVAHNDYLANTQIISVMQNTSYIFSSDLGYSFEAYLYDKNQQFIGRAFATNNKFTTSEETYYINWRTVTTGQNSLNCKVQLEKGTTATSYEPYQEKTLNIDLQGNELCSLPDGTKDELVIENGRAKIIKNTRHLSLAIKDMNNAEVYAGWRNVPFLRDDYPNQNSLLDNITSSFLYNIGVVSEHRIAINTTGIRSILFLLKSYNKLTQSEWKEQYPDLTLDLYYKVPQPYEIDLGEVGNLSTFKSINNVSLIATMETNMNLVYYYKNYDLKFCGLVKNSGDISLNPRYPKYCSLQILDFKTLLSEGETLDFVINNKTIIQAIRMVISAISDYGFIEGNINIFNEDEEIGAYSTLNKTAYDVFQYLADISGSRWTTRLVDENTIAIDFYDTTLMPKGKNLEYNQKYWEDNKVVDLTFNFGTRDYRNKQIMLSDEVYADIDYSEEVITDGYTTTFNLSSNIGSIYSISINGQEATFTTQINKKIGVIADFYYEVGKSKIESDDLLTSGKVIKVTYIPLVKGRQIVYNNDEVARVTNQIGRKGTISRYESRNDVLSSSELNSIGQTYIKYKGSAEIILNLKVEDNDIYNVGDVVYFDAPIQNLAKDYMVKRKSIDIINVNDLQKIFYTYELTSSFNSERDINYFDNQRNKATGNISEGDTIDRNIDIEDTANIIFYGLEINEIQVEGDNTLNGVLNSPFIN